LFGDTKLVYPWEALMAQDQDIAVELIVPQEIAKQVESLPTVTVQSSHKVTDEDLRFGILEVIAILTIAKGVLSVTKTAIEIYKLLKQSGKPDAKAYIRSPEGKETIEISLAKTEEDIKHAVEEAYAE
jgi:hypothetical protein